MIGQSFLYKACTYFEKTWLKKMIWEEEDDGDDELLAEAFDRAELQWGGGDDELLVEALDRTELQLGGGASDAIQFELIPYTDRRARRFGVHRRVYTTCQSQSIDATANRGNIARRIENGLRRSVLRQVLSGEEHDDDFLFVNMSSNRLHHAYQSHRVSVGEWRRNEEPVQRLFAMMSRILNSNQQFEMDDSFHLEVTHVRNPARGSGKKRLKLGTRQIEKMLKSKKSVVIINNDDELCCARALVMVKAYRDKDYRYKDIREGRPVQGTLARELHHFAGVTEGACGLNEIALFQRYLTEYQLVVVSVDHGYQIIYKGPEQAEDKQLVLIKNGEHFHGCHSLKGFFGSSYYCLRCERKYSNEDFVHHHCPGLTCYACHQDNYEDQTKTKGAASVKCRLCERCFFGPTCFSHHLHLDDNGQETEKDSVCQVYKKCGSCGKVLTGKEKNKKEAHLWVQQVSLLSRIFESLHASMLFTTRGR